MIVLVNVISLAKSVFCKFKKSLNNIKKKSTCFRKCFFSYIRLAASDIAFGSDIRFASGIVLRTVWRANIISLRGSAISLLRQQKYRAAHRAAYHLFSLQISVLMI